MSRCRVSRSLDLFKPDRFEKCLRQAHLDLMAITIQGSGQAAAIQRLIKQARYVIDHFKENIRAETS